MAPRWGDLALGLVIVTALGACAVLPSPTPPARSIAASASPVAPDLAVSRDQAVAIARKAAGEIHGDLANIPVALIQQGRFSDHANDRGIRVSPPPPGDRGVWVIGRLDEVTGPGVTVVVDATDGRVLRAVNYIR